MRYRHKLAIGLAIMIIISIIILIWFNLPKWNNKPPSPDLVTLTLFKGIIGAVNMYYMDFEKIPNNLDNLLGNNARKIVYYKSKYIEKDKILDGWLNPIFIKSDQMGQWVKLISYGKDGTKDNSNKEANDVIKLYYKNPTGGFEEFSGN